MDIELIEIREFLAKHHPFDQLPDAELDKLPSALESSYARRDTLIFKPGTENTSLYIIRSGAVEVSDENNLLLSRRGEGDTFGARSLLRGRTRYNVRAIEDTLLYKLPRFKFKQLCDHYERFAYFFHADGALRLQDAVQQQTTSRGDNDIGLMTLPIRDIVNRNWIMLHPDVSISEAAKKMTDEKASAILVCDNGKLAGIVTDRDMCSRCLAKEMDINAPIENIMTRNPYTITQEDYAYSALMIMSRRNIRHLPVLHQGNITGIVSASDLIQRQSASPIFLVGDIYKQTSIQQLAETSAFIPQVLVNLVDADATAHSIGHMISILGEAITTRLLQLAEEKMGPAPIDYCWLSFGSLARLEQTAQTDQDNGLLISNDFDPQQHGEYFEKLAHFVSDGLNACGYDYCPGDVMATNSKWRQTLNGWKRHFDDWINKPEPKALMHASIFFDMRCLHGRSELFNELQQYVLKLSRSNRIFLAHLAGNALHHTPPLGFFRRFVLVHDGEHNNTLDLKHNGQVPIIDLARIYALAIGINAVNTQSRLEAVGGLGEVSNQGAADLKHAMELIGIIRLRHQARLIKAGKKPDNFILPDELSNFERNHLKDAFEVVRTIQSALGQRYQTGRF
ncbi:MAG: cyclic nucleotide-binding/CBS domain-containing protein [Gammaproteobacteria bacterium]|nr:MAG: cyclic nucleotide-binding/CBS domain-containing protein [Gammaproteobacteria bacterium]